MNDSFLESDDIAETLALIDTSAHWLDYTLFRENENTAPPKRLIRFMPIEQYLSLLTTGALYFPRAGEYEDPYECAFPWSLSESISDKLLEECDEPEFALPGDVDRGPLLTRCESILRRRLSAELDAEPDRWFLSCWHAGEALTDLMWRSYGGYKGVAITCSGPHLLKQIQDSIYVKRNMLAEGRGLDDFVLLHTFVDYEPEAELFDLVHQNEEFAGPTINLRFPAFRKHRFFRLDAEYRFAARLHVEDTAYYQAAAKIDLAQCDTVVSTSPLCPPWVAQSVEAITAKYHPTVEVKRLSLD